MSASVGDDQLPPPSPLSATATAPEKPRSPKAKTSKKKGHKIVFGHTHPETNPLNQPVPWRPTRRDRPKSSTGARVAAGLGGSGIRTRSKASRPLSYDHDNHSARPPSSSSTRSRTSSSPFNRDPRHTRSNPSLHHVHSTNPSALVPSAFSPSPQPMSAFSTPSNVSLPLSAGAVGAFPSSTTPTGPDCSSASNPRPGARASINPTRATNPTNVKLRSLQTGYAPLFQNSLNMGEGWGAFNPIN